MKKVLTAALALAITTLFCGAAALAEDGQKKPGQHHGRPDIGKIRKEMDTNNDQEISKAEFDAWHQKRIDERFAKMDRNGDGVLSKADRPQGQRPGDGAGTGGGNGDGEGSGLRAQGRTQRGAGDAANTPRLRGPRDR